MEPLVLIYDSKCSLCRALAHKVRDNAKDAVELKALTDPEAGRLLRRFYPDGWSHSFYLISGDVCDKGVFALRGLRKTLGSKQLALLLGEYTSLKLRATQYGAEHPGDHEHKVTRRKVLKAAAVTPIMYPLARMPRMPEPFGKTPGDLTVNISEVSRGSTGFTANAWRCNDCVRSATPLGSVPDGSTAPRLIEDTTLRDERIRLDNERASGSAQAALLIRRTTFEGERLQGTQPELTGMTVHNGLLDARRYNVGFSVGQQLDGPDNAPGEYTTMAGLIGHDLSLPIVDFIVFSAPGDDTVVDHLDAYRVGLRELAALHANARRNQLSRLYEEMDAGLDALRDAFDGTVSDVLVPLKNRFAVTSTPELLRFVELPLPMEGPSIVSHGCTCSLGCCCGCGTCVGCGFNLGFCTTFLCGACVGCGCGCGYCCGCAACA